MTSHLVIGGSGFLGRHLVRALLSRGDEVTVADRDLYRSEERSRSPRSMRLDLSSTSDAQFDKILGDAEVIHFYAWSTIPQTANADPLGDLRVNLGGMLQLLEAMKRRGGGQIVFPSSGGTVYGRLKTVPVPEKHPLSPITAYGASKSSGELYLNVYRNLYGIDARVARIANPFGAGQDPQKPQGVASTVAFRALAGQTVEVWGSGDAVRDFIHVNDAVEGLLAITDAQALPVGELPIFNIGSGRGASVNEIISIVEHQIGRRIQIARKPERPFDVPTSVLDISKAKNELCWTPKIGIREGIERMISDLVADPHRLFSTP